MGDTTYAINTIIDYGGVPWVGKADGMYAPDQLSDFKNQSPQLAQYPNTALNQQERKGEFRADRTPKLCSR